MGGNIVSWLNLGASDGFHCVRGPLVSKVRKSKIEMRLRHCNGVYFSGQKSCYGSKFQVLGTILCVESKYEVRFEIICVAAE